MVHVKKKKAYFWLSCPLVPSNCVSIQRPWFTVSVLNKSGVSVSTNSSEYKKLLAAA